MKSAKLVNLILETLITGKVEFLYIYGDIGKVEVGFSWGGNNYEAGQEANSDLVFVKRALSPVRFVTDEYSSWVEGVLNGKRRTDGGELCTK